ncbi:MAG TPA: hypothetical protein PLU72_16565 [Candidatus Ozemobacteraceae bacterium]|mgnify:FL=1|nr:hypothetical protein [Candidatus Ozemobacteraceae bacterium]
MKCTRLEDWYEKHGDDRPDDSFRDVIAHARGCPECAAAMANRAFLLETMHEMPAPAAPHDLAARIGQFIDIEEGEPDDPASAPNLLDSFIEAWLRPVQTALVAACVGTIVWIGIADVPRQAPARYQIARFSGASERHLPEHQSMGRAPDERGRSTSAAGQALTKLSEEDVAAFMRKMNEYRRSHPEMDDPESRMPAGMLAADR